MTDDYYNYREIFLNSSNFLSKYRYDPRTRIFSDVQFLTEIRKSLYRTEKLDVTYNELPYLAVKSGTLWSDFHAHLCDKKEHLNKLLSLATSVVLSGLLCK